MGRRRKKRSGMYDPQPRRRRRRHDPGMRRKGRVPPQLRAWVFRRRTRRTHDPGYMRTMHRGPRGGTYFAGPKKRRYDPQPRRHFGRIRRYGSKVESGFNRWATWIGVALGALLGIGTGINEYGGDWGKYWATLSGQGSQSGQPEIAHLWSNIGTFNPASYLQYKFLGMKDGQYVGSAWVYGFWGGIAAYIFSKLPLGHKLHRIQRPLGKIGIGMAAMSAAGAIALPGSPNAPVLDMIGTGQPTGNRPFGRGSDVKIV